MKARLPAPSPLRDISRWLSLSREEILVASGILLLFAVGWIARYAYLKSEKVEPDTPAGIERIDMEMTNE